MIKDEFTEKHELSKAMKRYYRLKKEGRCVSCGRFKDSLGIRCDGCIILRSRIVKKGIELLEKEENTDQHLALNP